MARLNVASGDNLQKIAFHSEIIWRETLNSLLFTPFMGAPGESSFVKLQQPVIGEGVLRSFTQGKGSGAKDRFFMPLSFGDAAVKNGSRDVATGLEEAIVVRDFDHELDMYEKDISTGTLLTHFRSAVDLSSESLLGLKNFIVDHTDSVCIDALYSDSTPTGFVYLNNSDALTTATSEPATGSLTSLAISPQFLAQVSQVARTADSDAGVLLNFRMKKVKINGKAVFLLLVPPSVATEIRIDATYSDYVKRVESMKGDPIFESVVALIDDILIVESEKISKDTTNKIARCTLMGENSLVVSLGKSNGVLMDIVEVDRNAGRESLLVGRWFIKASKPQFANSAGTSKDFGSLCVPIRYGQ